VARESAVGNRQVLEVPNIDVAITQHSFASVVMVPIGKNTHLAELAKMAHHVDDQRLEETDLSSPVVVGKDLVDVFVLFISVDTLGIVARRG
jgi:hypothetical protein